MKSNSRMRTVTKTMLVLDYLLILILFSRGEIGPGLLLVMFPWVLIAMIPPVLATIGVACASPEGKRGLIFLGFVSLMVALNLVDLSIPLTNKGYDPELEPGGRIIFLFGPYQAMLGLATLIVGLLVRCVNVIIPEPASPQSP